jgi:hypothetical protein
MSSETIPVTRHGIWTSSFISIRRKDSQRKLSLIWLSTCEPDKEKRASSRIRPNAEIRYLIGQQNRVNEADASGEIKSATLLRSKEQKELGLKQQVQHTDELKGDATPDHQAQIFTNRGLSSHEASPRGGGEATEDSVLFDEQLNSRAQNPEVRSTNCDHSKLGVVDSMGLQGQIRLHQSHDQHPHGPETRPRRTIRK